MTSYLTAIVMFAVSLTIYEIFAKQIKCKSLILEMQIKEEENGTVAIRLEMFDSV